MKIITPASFGQRLQLKVSLGVQDAEVTGDKVLGHFRGELVQFEAKSEGRLIDKFLNCPGDLENVLGFTRQYGPLESAAEPGAEFTFAISEFRDSQSQLGQIWKNLDTHPEQDLFKGGSLRFSRGTVSFIAKSLYWYLYTDLLTIPVERVRICKRDKCVHPYFIAGHLRQRFCGDECAENAQRELKKDWWDKKGQAWRAKRRIDETAEEEGNGAKKKG